MSRNSRFVVSPNSGISSTEKQKLLLGSLDIAKETINTLKKLERGF